MKRMGIGLAIGFIALLVGAPAGLAQERGLLVDAAWLKVRLAEPKIRIVDMVTEPGDYRKGHIPGAVYLHVDDSRIGVPAGGFRLPNVEEGAKLLGGLGITPETQGVIYDEAGGPPPGPAPFRAGPRPPPRGGSRRRGGTSRRSPSPSPPPGRSARPFRWP